MGAGAFARQDGQDASPVPLGLVIQGNIVGDEERQLGRLFAMGPGQEGQVLVPLFRRGREEADDGSEPRRHFKGCMAFRSWSRL